MNEIVENHYSRGRNGDNGNHLSNVERRIENKIDNARDTVEDKVEYSYDNLGRDLHHSERRLQHRVHEVEDTLKDLVSDFFRHTEVGLERNKYEVKLEAERTRDTVVRTALETRLYLRDREDRTNDLLHRVAERNHEDETRTRDLIRDLERCRPRDYDYGHRRREHDIQVNPRINIALDDLIADDHDNDHDHGHHRRGHRD